MLTTALSCLNHRSYFETHFHEASAYTFSNSLLSHHTSQTSWQSTRKHISRLCFVLRILFEIRRGKKEGAGEFLPGVSGVTKKRKSRVPTQSWIKKLSRRYSCCLKDKWWVKKKRVRNKSLWTVQTTTFARYEENADLKLQTEDVFFVIRRHVEPFVTFIFYLPSLGSPSKGVKIALNVYSKCTCNCISDHFRYSD